MKDYFKLLGINSNLGREDILSSLHRDLRTWTNRTSNPIKEKRDKAEEMVIIISEAIDIFSGQASYNNYINQLNQFREQMQEQKGPQRTYNQQPQPQPQSQPKPQTITVDQALENALTLLGFNDDAAFKHINDAIKAAPNYPRCWNVLATYYKRKNNIEQAIAAYNRMLSIDPKNYIASYNLFLIYCDRDDIDKVKALYDVLYPPIKDKNDAYAHYISGHYNLVMKNYDLAIKDFDEVRRIINIKDDLITNLNVDPFMFYVNEINIKKDIAKAYYEKCRLYTFGTNDTSYLTTKKDVIAFISMLDNAISSYPADFYKRKRDEAKGLFEKVKLKWWGRIIISYIDLIFIGILMASFAIQKLNPYISPDKQVYATIITNNIFRAILVLIILFSFKFFKTTKYLENGARLAGKNKYSWNFRRKLFGEKRPKVKF